MKNSKEIITMTGENGKEMQFELVAEVAYDMYNYLIVLPTKKYEGMDPDMALVFRVETTEDGDVYELECDDDIIDAVGEIYNSELA